MERPDERFEGFQRSEQQLARCGLSWLEARELCLAEARRMGLDEQDAQDVAQEAVLRGWRARHKVRGPQRPWYRAIARNEARRLAGKPIAVPTSETPETPGPDPAEGVDLRIDLERAAQELTPQDRSMLSMHYQLGYSYPALAAHFDVPVGTVKVRLHRARAKLRATLTQGRA